MNGIKSAFPDFAELVTLSRNFQVSLESLLFHLINIGLINNRIKEKLQANKHIQEYDHQTKATVKEQNSRLGERLTRLVFLAYQQEKISRARAAEILNIPLRQLPSFLE